MRAYSMDIRERVIENLDHESMRKTAKRFGVSEYVPVHGGRKDSMQNKT